MDFSVLCSGKLKQDTLLLLNRLDIPVSKTSDLPYQSTAMHSAKYPKFIASQGSNRLKL